MLPNIFFHEMGRTLLTLVYNIQCLFLHFIKLLFEFSELLLKLWQVYKSLVINPRTNGFDRRLRYICRHSCHFTFQSLYFLFHLHKWYLNFSQFLRIHFKRKLNNWSCTLSLTRFCQLCRLILLLCICIFIHSCF